MYNYEFPSNCIIISFFELELDFFFFLIPNLRILYELSLNSKYHRTIGIRK